MTSLRLPKNQLKQKLILPIILVSFIILNFFWGIFGFFAYLPRTDGVLFFLWLFVPDCPLYSFLFALFLLDRERFKSHQSFMWILTFGLLKFSLAAPVIFLLLPDSYHALPIFGFTLPNIYPFDYFHLILLFQGLIMAIFVLERSWHNFSIAFGWLLLNDFIDFVFLTFPYYNDTLSILETATVYYILINLVILVLGTFFTLNGFNFVKNALGIEAKQISLIPTISSNIIEKEIK